MIEHLHIDLSKTKKKKSLPGRQVFAFIFRITPQRF